MPTDSNNGKQQLERLVSLEQRYDSLASDVKQLASSVDRFASETRASIDRLTEKIASQQRTPWATLAGWAAVVLAVVGLGLASFARDGSRLEAAIMSIAEEAREHGAERGHPALSQMVASNADGIRQLGELVRKLQGDSWSKADQDRWTKMILRLIDGNTGAEEPGERK